MFVRACIGVLVVRLCASLQENSLADRQIESDTSMEDCVDNSKSGLLSERGSSFAESSDERHNESELVAVEYSSTSIYRYLPPRPTSLEQGEDGQLDDESLALVWKHHAELLRARKPLSQAMLEELRRTPAKGAEDLTINDQTKEEWKEANEEKAAKVDSESNCINDHGPDGEICELEKATAKTVAAWLTGTWDT